MPCASSMMWIGLFKQMKALREKRLTSLEKQELCQQFAFGLELKL